MPLRARGVLLVRWNLFGDNCRDTETAKGLDNLRLDLRFCVPKVHGVGDWDLRYHCHFEQARPSEAVMCGKARDLVARLGSQPVQVFCHLPMVMGLLTQSLGEVVADGDERRTSDGDNN